MSSNQKLFSDFFIPSLVFSELAMVLILAMPPTSTVVVSTYLGTYDKVQPGANNEHLHNQSDKHQIHQPEISAPR